MPAGKPLFSLALFLAMLCAAPAYPAEWEKNWKEFDACLGDDRSVKDRSAAAAYYSCRRPVLECLTYLETPSFWYDASPHFREGMDRILQAPPEATSFGEYICRKSVQADLFESLGTLTVTGSPDDAALYLNGVFAGRLPLERIEMPPGDYVVILRSPSGEARDRVTVRSGETSVVSLDAVAGQKYDDASPHPRASVRRWWRSTNGERVKTMWAADGGVVVMLSNSRTFRGYDGETGAPMWEKVLSLAAATEPRQVGDSLFWVSGTGMFNSLELASGRTEMLGKVGTGKECLVAADGERVYAAGAAGRGGTIKAFSLRKGTETWSLDVPEVPRELVVAGKALLLLTEDAGLGSGTLVSVDAATGRRVWDRFAADAGQAVLTRDGATVFFWGGGREEAGAFFNGADGKDEAPLIVESGARPVAAMLADGHFFIITDDERIYAYDPAAGRILWDKGLGKGGARASILDVDRGGVTLFVDEARSRSRKSEVRGVLVTLSRKSGETLFSGEVKLNQRPFFAGKDRLVVPDQLGTAFVRDLDRDCTAWQFRSTAPGMIRGSVVVAGGEDRLYLAAPRQDRIFAFAPGACPPPLSLPDLPALERTEPEPKRKGGREEMFTRKTPLEKSLESKLRPSPGRKKSVGETPARRNVGRKRPAKEEDFDSPPAPTGSGGIAADLPPLEKIPRSEMVGRVTQPALLERLAMWCAEHLDEWVVPETDGRDPMGNHAGPFAETWILRRPLEYRLSDQGRYTFVFDKAGVDRGGKGRKAGFGVTLVDPVFVSLPGDRRAVSFGIKTDKGFVGFWDGVARAEIAGDGTAVKRVEVRIFLPYAKRGSFRDITREDLNGDGDPETIVRYAPHSGGARQEGQVELYYIVGREKVLFKTEDARILSRRGELVRETSVVVFEDHDRDGVKEMVMEKFSAPCCGEDAWPEKITEEPLVYRLVNNVYTAVP